MVFSIPFYDLVSENQVFAFELHQALDRIIASGRFVLGQEVAELENGLADYLGVKEVVGVKSGTDALYFGMRALGIGAGDEVITTPFTFPATVEAILRTGARPVLADVDPMTLCLSPERCQEVITPRTRAIVLVHLFGNCADMERFVALCQEHNLTLIEDAAQAIGAEYRGRRLGSFGAVAGFSFYPTKNLGAIGNAGAVATNGVKVIPSPSARMDEIQAAVLWLKLRRLAEWRARREYLANRYIQALGGLVRIVQGADGCLGNFHQFAIRIPERDRLREFLAGYGVETRVYYEVPVHRLPEFAGLFAGARFPEAERASAEVLCLPIRQNLTDAEQEVIINLVIDFFRRYGLG